MLKFYSFSSVVIFLLVLTGMEAVAQSYVERPTVDNAAGPFNFPVYNSTNRAIVADFDGDGDADILYQLGGDGTEVRYRRNNGGASFTDLALSASPFAAAGPIPDFVTANSHPADYDLDGDIDLWISLANAPGAYFRNDGATFTRVTLTAGPTTFPSPQFFSRVFVADFTNDGFPDVLYQTGGAGTPLGFRRNNGTPGTPTFTDVLITDPPFSGVTIPDEVFTGFYTADYDSDGDLDLWVGGGGGIHPEKGYYFRYDGPNYTLQSNAAFPSLNAPGDAFVGDMDTDGDADILYQDGGAGAPYVHASNNGNATFTSSTLFAGFVFSDINIFKAGDFDGDGDLDIWHPANGVTGKYFEQAGDPPDLVSSSPADNATNVPLDANINLVFSENVTIGSGYIQLVRLSDNNIQTFTLPSPNVTGSGTTWSVNPPADLQAGVPYALKIEAGAFRSASLLPYKGISSLAELNFIPSANLPPVLANLNGDAATFTEGDANALLDVGSNVTVTDPDSPDFNGGTFSMEIPVGGLAEDNLQVLHTGTGAGQIGVAGNNISYGGVLIGTLSGTNLSKSIALNANATPVAVTALIKACAYTNASELPNTTARSIKIDLNDGESGIATAIVTLNVAAVNDGPVVTAPANIPVTEDVAIALTAISFADVDAGAANVLATFTIDGGALAATGVPGVTVGGTAAALTLTGNITAINTFISEGRLTFTPAANITTAVTMTVLLNDNGNTGTDPGLTGGPANEEDMATVSLQITAVNDVPVITAPPAISVTEDAATAISGYSFADADAGAANVTVTLTISAGAGTLAAASANSVTAAVNAGNNEVTLTGNITNLNTFIADLRVTFLNPPNVTADVPLTIAINDGGNTGSGGNQSASEIVTIQVTPLNDPPVVTAPAPAVTIENTAVTIPGISVADADVNEGTGQVELTLTVTNGNVTLTGIAGLVFTTGDGTADAAMTFSGTLAAVNAAINGITFNPTANHTGSAAVQIDASDLGNNPAPPGTDTKTVAITVTPSAPVVTGVSSAAPDGMYKTGDNLPIQITFSYAVFVDVTGGTPALELETGAVDRTASYTSGSGTSTLTFTYTVQAGDLATDLDYTAAAALSLHGGSIKDAGSVDAILTLPATGGAGSLAGNKALVIDGVAPQTSSVNIPANGTYVADDVLNLTVNYTEAVTVNTTGGAPSVPVTIGGGGVQAVYTGGSGTTALVFNYTVQPGEEDQDGIVIGNTIQLNGGVMADVAGNPAGLQLNAIPDASAVLVDAQAPTIISVGLPPDKKYKAGDQLDFTVQFSENIVTGGGSLPALPFTIGSTVVNAGLLPAGSSGNVLAFRYVVQPGQEDTDGITLQAALLATGATIRDNAGNDAVLALNGIPSATGILVDGVSPLVTSVSVPGDGIYKEGDVLQYTVQYDENVVVSTTGGTPSIALAIGSAVRTLVYASGSGSAGLVFAYTVQAGDLDADGVAIGSMALNGGTIKDEAGNDADNTLHNTGSELAVKVDAVAPVITAGQVFTIAENSAAGTMVGTVAATDAGIVSPLQQFSITANANPDGDANAAFSIDAATGTITVTDAGDLNYETNTFLNISVTVSDGVNTSAAQTVRINLTNIGEPPLDILLGNSTIVENNAVNSVVGALTSTAGEPGSTFTYTLVPGAGSADNAVFVIAGSNLEAAQVLNFETKSTYNVRIRSTAQSGEFLEKAFVITVNDVNEAPTLNAVADQTFCARNADEVIALAGISAGPEPGQSVTVTVSSDNAALFTLLTADAGGIRFRIAASATGGANVTVTVKDDGGTANGGVDEVSRTFRLNVSAIAAPVITSNKGTNISKGDIAELTATGGQTYQWDNVPGIISGATSTTLVIRPQQNQVYRVTATNAAGCSSSAEIAIETVDDYKVDGVNILTPNGDGRNDRFIIRNIDSYPNNELKIFDRSGRLIYTKRGYQNEWDGRLNGNALEEGTYYYFLDFGSGLPKVKGYISIIRDK